MDTTTRRTVGFWVLATTLVAFLAASSAPTPLYLVYQSRWHFSAVMLTVAFATYAVALLLTLLTVGGLSDYLGRRRVLAGALVIELVAMLIFIFANGLGWLLVARAVQGVATGIAAGALSAAITDLAPSGRPSLASAVNTAAPSAGLAIGAIVSGALVQYAPAPRTLIYLVLIVLFVTMLLALLFVPETVERRSGSLASLRPRASVPPQAIGAFRVALPVLIATWAVGGLVLSLGPSLAAAIFGLQNHLVGGLVVTAVAGTGALASVTVRSAPARPTMVRGSLVLVIGVAIVLIALATESTPTFFVGLVICGWGFGAAFIGAFGSVASLANALQRAEVFAALYVASYLAFGGSAVLAGLAVPHFGLRPTASVYGAIVIVLSLAAAAAGRGNRMPKVEPADPELAASEETCTDTAELAAKA